MTYLSDTKNNNMKYYTLTFIISIIFFSSCHRQEVSDDIATAFRMSDTMMKKCGFYTATLQPVNNQLRLFGKIEPDNNKVAQVYSIVGGNVIKINVELGDYVKKGQVLAVVRSGEVAEFFKEKLNAKSDVVVEEKNLQVAKDMYAGKLSTEKEVLAAERELEKAKNELARINEIYNIYGLQKGSDFEIIAPTSGFILQKDINQNEQLRADNSSILFSIAEINEVWAIANVNESDISKVKIDYKAEITTLSFPDEKYTGKIDKIFNAIDPETKAMKVRVRIPNSDLKLKPEMNATVIVKYTDNQKMIAIPASAVIFDKSKEWVMVFKDRSNIETRRVYLYNQNGDTAYIKKGLKEGEKVISKNGLLIYDALND